jgi:hypothetical protein
MAFSITESQYNALLARMTAAEQQLNDTAVAIDKFITATQLLELNVLFQTEIERFKISLEALELRVTAIEEEPLT